MSYAGVAAPKIQRIASNDEKLKCCDLEACELGVEGANAVTLYKHSFFNGLKGNVHILQVADALANNTILQVLILEDNNIGDEGLTQLCEALSSKNTTLKSLNIGNNGITKAGIDKICGMLFRSRYNLIAFRHVVKKQQLNLIKLGGLNLILNTVNDFFFQGNKFGEAGCKAVARVLETENKTLQKIYLGYNAVGEYGAGAFQKTLRTNTSLILVTLNANLSFLCSRLLTRLTLEMIFILQI